MLTPASNLMSSATTPQDCVWLRESTSTWQCLYSTHTLDSSPEVVAIQLITLVCACHCLLLPFASPLYLILLLRLSQLLDRSLIFMLVCRCHFSLLLLYILPQSIACLFLCLPLTFRQSTYRSSFIVLALTYSADILGNRQLTEDVLSIAAGRELPNVIHSRIRYRVHVHSESKI